MQKAALIISLSLLLPSVVHAQGSESRKSPLAGQPAIRHKFELRELRLEVAPAFETTISADFKNTYGIGLKVHLTDFLSLGGVVFYGLDSNTGLLDQIVNTLPNTQGADPTPTRDQALSHANSMPFHGAIALTFTPWAGKISLFGKTFITFDLYVSGGLGFAVTKNDFTGPDEEGTCDQNCTDGDPMNDVFDDPRNDNPQNAGFQPGIYVGGGIHLFFSHWMALDIAIRNYMFADNPSGLDFSGNNRVTKDDRRFLTHLFVGLSLSFYLPTKPKVSR
jgi:outer membrane beta-barrel protein